ncbi:MAG: hypothetical protein NTZ54_02660 [Alphaproteobacteria bacterium]|nr:hypothetical protein [Alphaproteobacteria bacterium]
MKPVLLSLPLAASAVFFASAGLAAGMLTDAKGMTLYVFDKDTKGISSCYGACATMWPPYLVNGEKAKGEGWSMTKRKDGAEQWGYDGKPRQGMSAGVRGCAPDAHSTGSQFVAVPLASQAAHSGPSSAMARAS